MKSCRLVIANPDATDFDLEKTYPLGLPIDIAAFIHMHCWCAHCGVPISRDLKRCSCDHPKNPNLHLEVEYSTLIDRSKFMQILNRENARIKSMYRKQRLDANGGSFTKDNLADLYRIQEGLCYFCGDSISMDDSGNHFHVDHYHAISKGGRNDIFNIVLTCASCNLRKGAMNGDDFKRMAKKVRIPNIGRKLGRIRKNLKVFLASMAGKEDTSETSNC